MNHNHPRKLLPHLSSFPLYPILFPPDFSFPDRNWKWSSAIRHRRFFLKEDVFRRIEIKIDLIFVWYFSKSHVDSRFHFVLNAEVKKIKEKFLQGWNSIFWEEDRSVKSGYEFWAAVFRVLPSIVASTDRQCSMLPISHEDIRARAHIFRF